MSGILGSPVSSNEWYADNRRLNFQQPLAEIGAQGDMQKSLLDAQLANQLKLQQSQFARQDQLLDRLLGQGGVFGNVSQPGGPDAGLFGQLDQFAEGRRSEIDQGFQTAMNNAMGMLDSRGLGGSSLVGGSLAPIARQREFSLTDLLGGVTEQKIGVQERAADRSTQLLSSLLGSVFRI